MSTPVLAFDMNGTLLDTGVLDPHFAELFGSPSLRREWFMQLIELAMTSAITGYYIPFLALARSALQVLAERHDRSITPALEHEFLETLKNMPAFPDVKLGLEALKRAGVRLAVLTNSPLATAEHVLKHAGIRSYFERVMSVEAVQTFKPSPEVYRYGARELGISPADLMMVAAHAWDTTGAIRAGCQAAFVRRPGQALDPTAPAPAMIVTDIEDLARRLASAA